MSGIISTNEEMRKAQKIAVGKTLEGGDLVEDLGLGVGVTSQWN
jgi:hypothetical protein